MFICQDEKSDQNIHECPQTDDEEEEIWNLDTNDKQKILRYIEKLKKFDTKLGWTTYMHDVLRTRLEWIEKHQFNKFRSIQSAEVSDDSDDSEAEKPTRKKFKEERSDVN